MSSIQYPNYPVIPYCQPSDVLSLLGGLTFTTAASGTPFLTTAISHGQAYLEEQTDRTFNPRRYVELYDGTGTPSLTLANYPVISIAFVKNWISQVLLARTQADYSLSADYKSGIVRTPLTLISAMFAQFNYKFYKGNKNVQVDYWAGFTKDVYGEQLTTTDNQTFAFANPTLAKTLNQLTTFGPIASNPPVYRPIVYLNGEQITNTTYQYNANNNGDIWTVAQDNLEYSVNWTAGTITFNAPVSGTVTADYTYYLIPLDIASACAKYAAIEVLKTEGVGIGGSFSQGAAIVQVDGTRIQYGKDSAAPWEGVILAWQKDIDAVVERYRRRGPTTQGGYQFMDGGF